MRKDETKPTFNHAFDIAWQVPESEYEDGYDCLEHEKERVFSALLKRVQDLMGGRYPREYMEAIGHFDTYEEEPTEIKNAFAKHRPSVTMMSAAPELLAALENLVYGLPSELHDNKYTNRLIGSAKDAIAKAKGEKQ